MSENQNQENLDRFNQRVSSLTLQGWKIVDKNEKGLSCVLEKAGAPVNHFIHGILTMFTCAWGIVWYIKWNNSKNPKRCRVSIDSSGNLLEEQA